MGYVVYWYRNRLKGGAIDCFDNTFTIEVLFISPSGERIKSYSLNVIDEEEKDITYQKMIHLTDIDTNINELRTLVG